MADSGYKNVSRIDSPKKHLHGWYMRIQHKNQSYSKFFSDKKYGGSSEALQEAVDYRNRLERKLGRPRTERQIIGGNTRKNNSTGHKGIFRRKKFPLVKNGKRYYRDVFEVVWAKAPGKLTRTTVSVRKYGEKEALKRAIAVRKQRMEEIYAATREPDPAKLIYPKS